MTNEICPANYHYPDRDHETLSELNKLSEVELSEVELSEVELSEVELSEFHCISWFRGNLITVLERLTRFAKAVRSVGPM